MRVEKNGFVRWLAGVDVDVRGLRDAIEDTPWNRMLMLSCDIQDEEQDRRMASTGTTKAVA